MVESGLSSPERDNNPSELAALHNTLQTAFADPANPIESLAVQQEQFSAVIAVAREQYSDERAQALIDHYATIVDFVWFKGNSDTLPAALGYFWAGSSRDDDWGTIGFKDDIIESEVFDAITQTLMPLGLGDLLLERITNSERNQTKIDAAYKNLVDSTPGAKWFEAFNVGTPRMEMPLSATERAGREAAIQESAIRRFGPAPHMPDRPHLAAHRLTNRQILQLDEETSIRPRPHTRDDLALRGLMRYVDASIAKRRISDAPVVRQEYDPESVTLSEYDATHQRIARYDLVEIGCYAADDSGLPLGITYDIDTISREFYVDAFIRAYAGLGSHRAIYEAALAESRQIFLNPMIAGFNLVSGGSVIRALSYLKQVAKDHPFDQGQSWSERNQFSPDERREKFSHPTQEGHEREQRTLIGTIEKYNNPMPGTMRLLQRGRAESQLPLDLADESEADLILALRNFKGDPHVPGYQLIAANRLTHRYYFAYMPDADPYRPNTTPIPGKTKQVLVDQYGQAGLSGLARDVRKAKDFAISRLADLSQQHSTYMSRPPTRPDFTSMLTSIPSFTAFVDRNRLRGTCDVYSVFGKLSVNEILPPRQSYVTAGYVITGESNKISAVAHSQLAITADDNYTVESIIEWTASAENNPSRDFIESRKGQGVDTVYNVPPSSSSRESMTGPPLTAKEQIEVSTRQLLMQLGVVFAPDVAEQIPNEYIFSKVKALGGRHLIAQTLGVLLRANDVPQSSERLSSEYTSEFLGVLAKIAILRQRDRTGTTHPQLDMLEAALTPVVRFGEAPEVNASKR
ncbi:MAG TPA: hypothetical protein VJ836_07610 [Candidatus Saccharimonadales bacterium]|nr:hypothetical protein [Candidatus Saccharimonadales bacterium]